jgi:hypothetical protein
MKIKSFKESFSDKFYQQVEDFFDQQVIDFTQQNKMDKLIESTPGFRSAESKRMIDQIFRPFFINDSFYEKRGIQRRNGVLSYRIESNDWICFIFESDDEWFWVNLEEQKLPCKEYFFKCDQFDGLVKLLKDKKVI